MQKKTWIIFLTLLVTGCAVHAVTSGRVAIRDNQAQAEARFSDRDRAIIKEYYRTAKPRKTLPGLAKSESLPPGLAKRDTLPSGYQGILLPRELAARLSVIPATQARVIVGRDIVLIQRETRVILDILRNSIRE
ncbi:MAG: hypothetical protein AMS22_14135 [Thiotrichales bacterium SG8_50]|nr:MAG: hypothetical protein AMS22_14135 [Thiotrichales bacterium SG8_50]